MNAEGSTLRVMLETTHGDTDTDGRSTRWETHKAERRSAVLDAAVTAIEQDGPGVGVKRIAERVGLPRSVVYRHFADRADLDGQVRQRIVEMLMGELQPTLRPDGTPLESIRRAVDAYLGWIERHPRLHTFLGGGSGKTRGGSKVAVGTKAAIAAETTELFAAALRHFDADTRLAGSIAFGLVGFVDATVNHWLAERDTTLSTDELAEYLTRSVWLVLDGNLRALGIQLDPHTPVSELFAG